VNIRNLFLVLTSVLVGSAAAQPVQTSVCEITQSQASFDGKIVRLRATVVSGFEAFGIRDPGNETCATIWLSYPGGGPVASTSFGPATPRPYLLSSFSFAGYIASSAFLCRASTRVQSLPP
jgi:hypothetical protein